MIDIAFAILIILACYKGYAKGLIVGLFSFVGFIIGLAAALKLSVFVAEHLQKDVNISNKILPFLSFALVFLATVLIVHLGAKLVEKIFQMLALGWANKLCGIFLYVILYTLIFSVFLFYIEKIHFFNKSTIESSQTYPYIKPFGPKVINSIGNIVPAFKNMFTDLENFFENIPQKV